VAWNVPERDFSLTGYLKALGGQAEGYQRLRRMYQLSGLTASQPSLLQVGSLFVKMFPSGPEIPEFKSHGSILYYAMSGTAVPGAWTGMYSNKGQTRTDFGTNSATGLTDLGICVANDSPGALYPFSNIASGGAPSRVNVFQRAYNNGWRIFNPGDLPCPLRLSIYIPARTSAFYVKVFGPGFNRRVVVTPNVGGVADIYADNELWIPPGNVGLELQESDGTLITTANTTVSWYGTRWRYSGLQLDEYGGTDSMSQEWPVWYQSGASRKVYSFAAANSAAYGISRANEPAIGHIVQGNGPSLNGHILESQAVNLILRSNDPASAPWMATGVTAVSNNVTSPLNLSNNAATLTATLADSYINQAVSVSATTIYTFSVWLRTNAGTNTVNISVNDGTTTTTTACALTTTWQRFSVTATTGGAAVSLTCQIGGTSTFASPEVIYMYGAQVENRQYPSSYVYPHTTTASVRRERDCLAMVQPDHNLIAWSNRFDKTTATRGTEGLWWTNGTFSTTRQTGPDGTHVNAWQWTGGVGANTDFEQAIPNPNYLQGRTVTWSVWLKSTAATAAGYALTMYITEGAVTALATRVITVTDEWQRFSLSYRLTSETQQDIRVSVWEGVGGSRVFQVFGSQVTVSGTQFSTAVADVHVNPYYETQSSPVYPCEGMAIPKHLSQNGYIEFDVNPHYVPGSGNSPASQTYYLMEHVVQNASTGYEGIRIWRDSGFASGVHTLSARMNSVNDSYSGSSAQVTAQVTPTTGTIFKNAYTKLRLTWTNYVVAGTRTMQLQLQATDSGGTVTTGTAVNATSGHNKWTWALQYSEDTGGLARNQVSDLFYFIGGFTTALYGANYRNIKFGVPSIPSNAVPEPY
jgi:hypothetical protein